MNLKEKSTFELMLELLCAFRGQLLPKEIMGNCFASQDELINVLSKRYALNFTSFNSVCEWALSSESPLSSEQIRKFQRLKELSEGNREFSSVFSEILSEIDNKKT